MGDIDLNPCCSCAHSEVGSSLAEIKRSTRQWVFQQWVFTFPGAAHRQYIQYHYKSARCFFELLCLVMPVKKQNKTHENYSPEVVFYLFDFYSLLFNLLFQAIGVSNQRETTVVWDKLTGEPLYNAVGKLLFVYVKCKAFLHLQTLSP